jgi:hypothetical protein
LWTASATFGDFRHGVEVPPQTPIPSALLGRPFLASTAHRLGLSAQVLRGRRFRRVFHAVYVEATVPDSLELRVDAVRLLVPEAAVVSHFTAAQLRGLPVPASDQIHISIPAEIRGPRIAGVRPHEGSPSAVLRHGRRISAPIDNFVELAETLSLVDLVILGDAMVRRGFCATDELVAGVASTRSRRGVRMARRAAALVRPRVDSPMETRLRLLLVFAGLPEPEPGYIVRDGLGEWVGEVDLAYDAYKIALEYHGDVHRTTRGRWQSDVAKIELLRALGWTVIVITAWDLDGRPERLLERIHAALEVAGDSTLPTAHDPSWRTHLLPGWARRATEPPRTGQLERGA